MPCYSTISINLGQTFDLAVLEAALRRLGLDPTRSGEAVHFTGGTYRNGTLRVTDGRGQTAADKLAADIRKAYTREGVATAARRQGLKVEFDQRDPAVLRITSDGRVL